MNTLAHADTFFFIATIGFVVVFLLVIIALFYLIAIFSRIHRISLNIEKDLNSLGDTAKEFVGQLWDSAIFSWLFGKKKRGRKSAE